MIAILCFGLVGWAAGYLYQQFLYVVYGVAAGLAVSLLLCIPDWPWFNRYVYTYSLHTSVVLKQ